MCNCLLVKHFVVEVRYTPRYIQFLWHLSTSNYHFLVDKSHRNLYLGVQPIRICGMKLNLCAVYMYMYKMKVLAVDLRVL